MPEPTIVWEDKCIALWSNGEMYIYTQEAKHEYVIDTLSRKDVRSLYDALTKFYKENKNDE